MFLEKCLACLPCPINMSCYCLSKVPRQPIGSGGISAQGRCRSRLWLFQAGCLCPGLLAPAVCPVHKGAQPTAPPLGTSPSYQGTWWFQLYFLWLSDFRVAGLPLGKSRASCASPLWLPWPLSSLWAWVLLRASSYLQISPAKLTPCTRAHKHTYTHTHKPQVCQVLPHPLPTGPHQTRCVRRGIGHITVC